jgi:hypothetical protein
MDQKLWWTGNEFKYGTASFGLCSHKFYMRSPTPEIPPSKNTSTEESEIALVGTVHSVYFDFFPERFELPPRIGLLPMREDLESVSVVVSALLGNDCGNIVTSYLRGNYCNVADLWWYIDSIVARPLTIVQAKDPADATLILGSLVGKYSRIDRFETYVEDKTGHLFIKPILVPVHAD